ncbi:FxLYD domain-containing protein [Streptomyces sp. ID05-39B]|uniref:FxLYD domain-containing protein n=1 Tax=Streptomyces sp. ID05-39B TaxID=3028664 RepID=UPI0029ACF16D|nr:FxLYD domain-containing protein [Streptomyces sp. ID05-39B]MDX3532463.1 FxLYD domain-containing protein [Streptomyces sp. ID05-39B]
MPAPRTPLVRAAVLTATCATVLGGLTALTGCSDEDSPSGVASRAESAAASLASRATEGFASATAEAGRRLDGIKGGVDAKDDVKAGAPKADGDRSTVEVTATNTDDTTRSFSVQVDFTDAGGKWLDTVLVTVPDVPAGRTGTATARSTHQLSGEVKAEVPRAVRY